MNDKIVRTWVNALTEQLRSTRQIVMLSGPRQVGKTSVSRQLLEEFDSQENYLNWDDHNHQELILKGPDAIIEHLKLDRLFAEKPLIVFDEIHKFRDWKNFIKGFFDRYEDRYRFMVTGSARLDLYRKGGDSLMGRYFNYRLHPLSVRELQGGVDRTELLQQPLVVNREIFQHLYRRGGFPEPYLQDKDTFSTRWSQTRLDQLVREDIRDATNIKDIHQLQHLVRLLVKQVGQGTKYSTLAKDIRVSVDTVSRWMEILESFYFCFRIRPWHKNIATALTKEPRTYLWDWSQIDDDGQRAENFIASHLFKYVQWLNDLGRGKYDLNYFRSKDKQNPKEVDLIVVREGAPWLLVEVKNSQNASISPHLKWLQDVTKAEYAFQVYIDGDEINANCFETNHPVKVPASTFLSQLV